MIPYYDADGVTIYCADYLDVLADLGPCDAVITDPPYNTRTADIDLKRRSPMRRDFGAWDQDFDPGPFVEHMAGVLRPGGSLIAFTSDRLLGRYRDASALKQRGTLVWIKANPAPHPRPQYVQATEFIAWLHKDGGPAVWNGSGYVPNVLHYPVCAGDERTPHPTQKPEALIMDLITRHTHAGDRVFDPFVGSGTTLAAAKRIGRRAVGVDVNEQYCEMAATRLQQSALPFVVAAAPDRQLEIFPGSDHE